MIPFESLKLNNTDGFREPENYRIEAQVDYSTFETGAYIHDDFSNEMDENEYVLMQFTGLLDKNGKEIYEGDIVKYEGYGGLYTEFSTVSFLEGQFVTRWEKAFIDVLDGGWDDCGLRHVNEDSEVIGNIYQNPELLTSEVN